MPILRKLLSLPAPGLRDPIPPDCQPSARGLCIPPGRLKSNAAVRLHKPHSGVFYSPAYAKNRYMAFDGVCGVATKGAGFFPLPSPICRAKNRWSARRRYFSGAPAQYLAQDFAKLQRVGSPARSADGRRDFLPAVGLLHHPFVFILQTPL